MLTYNTAVRSPALGRPNRLGVVLGALADLSPWPLVFGALLVVMVGAKVAQPSHSEVVGAVVNVVVWTIDDPRGI